MAEYRRRIVDDELDELAPSLAAVAIEGAKAVGKTETALQRARTVHYLDDPADWLLLEADPDRLEHEKTPVLLDEWQRHPRSWDLVRRSVDRNSSGGRFLLTGSATPTDAPTHSGAGRIVQVRMRPLSLAERDFGSPPTVSVRNLLTGDMSAVDGTTDLGLRDYADEIVRSGYPGIRGLGPRAARAQLDGYLARIVEREFSELGRNVRRPATLRAWLSAYAAATSTTASYTTVLDAASAGDSDKPAKTTTIAYREILTQLWVLDPVPAWTPSNNVFARLSQTPKHHLVDTALAARLLGLSAASLLANAAGTRVVGNQAPLLGNLFESLVAQSLRVYAQASEASVFHFRTQNGDREVDFIVEGADRRVLAIECKVGAEVSDSDVKHLRWLRERYSSHFVDAVVLTTGRYAYRRQDGIAVVPASLLGP